MSSVDASPRPSPWQEPGLAVGMQLQGRFLIGARAAWVVLAGLVVALFGASLPVGFAYLRTVCTEGSCSGPQLSAAGVETLSALGLSIDAFAAYTTAIIVIFAGGYFALAGAIFWRKSDEPLALLASLMLVTFGAAFPPTLDWLGASDPGRWWPSSLVRSLGLCLFFVFFYLFPDGRFVPGWTRALVPVMIVVQVSDSFFPGSPLNYGLWSPPLVFLLFLGWFSTVLFAQIHRYWHVSGPVQRQQTKWVVFGVAAALVGFLGIVLGGAVLPAETKQDPLLLSASMTASYLLMLLVPLSMMVAILRYRLWDIDPLINRALVYGTLTACVVGLYVLAVGGIGTLLQARSSMLTSILATGMVAVLIAPMRDRLQRGVNQFMYGERDDPYGVLSRLGQQLETTLAPEEVLPAIVQNVARALRLPHVAIWLADGDTLFLVAIHGPPPPGTVARDPGAMETLRRTPGGLRPLDLDPSSTYRDLLCRSEAVLVLPLTHRGELVGALSVGPRGQGDTFSPADRRLLRDLASQSGAAAHAVRLTHELRTSLENLSHSRERLVSAQEEERRRIQRDLHDGLGPILASIRLRLEACLDEAQEMNIPLTGELERLYGLVGQATGDIRRLVYDLRPPVLDQLGLVPAIQQHVARFSRETGLDTSFEFGEDLDIPAAAEVALLRIVQEALHNVEKHACASTVEVRLQRSDEALLLTVRDDGVGLSTALPGGTGIASMRERAEVLGGTVHMMGDPGIGTEVRVRIPVGSCTGQSRT